MKQNEWNEGLNNLDSDIIENYVMQKEAYSKKRKKPLVWTKYIAVAACMCLVFGVTALLLILNREDDPTIPAGDVVTTDEGEYGTTDDLPNIPIFDTPQYSAADISGILERELEDAVATNAYTKVYAPNGKCLGIDPLPTDEYIGIYKCNSQSYGLDRTEFTNFNSPILSKIEKYLGEKIPEYRIKVDMYYANGGKKSCLEADIDLENYNLNLSQRESYYRIVLMGGITNRKIVLDGEAIQINLQQIDEEIISSLETVKNKLFDMFGVEYSSAEVERRYYWDDQVPHVSVSYYDKENNPLRKMKDYIEISFDTKGNGYYVQVCQSRGEGNERLELQSMVKMITLDQAEELLYKGYVFGGHSCELCMLMQEKVSFEGYDYVDVEYQYDNEEHPTVAIPFYAFYKNIGTAQNGNTIYAKTLVCAIELSGYSEYFESQIEKHSSGVEFGTVNITTEIVTEETTEELATEMVTQDIITDEISSDSFIVEEIVTEDISS